MPFNPFSLEETSKIFQRFGSSDQVRTMTPVPKGESRTGTPLAQNETRKRKATPLEEITNTQEGGEQSTPGSSKRQLITFPSSENIMTDNELFQLQNQEYESTPITTPTRKKEDKVFKISAQTQDVLGTNKPKNKSSLLRRSSRVQAKQARKIIQSVLEARAALAEQRAQAVLAAQAAHAEKTLQEVTKGLWGNKPSTPLAPPAINRCSPMIGNESTNLCSPTTAVNSFYPEELSEKPKSSAEGFQRTDVEGTAKALEFSISTN